MIQFLSQNADIPRNHFQPITLTRALTKDVKADAKAVASKKQIWVILVI